MDFIKINIEWLTFSIVATSVLLFFLRKIAFSLNITDKPNDRKIHIKPVPLVGGLALFIMLAVLLFVSNNVNPFTFSLILSCGLVVFVGILDDVLGLSPVFRFVVQIIASLWVIYYSSIQINSFGFLLYPDWDLQLAYLSIPITVFGAVGIINALNMADGIDGLAAVTFFMPVLVLALLTHDLMMRTWLILFLSCVLIFVIFNKSKSVKVFLGDNGSLLLGFVLAWLLVYFSQGTQAVILPVTALYLVAIAVYDTIFVMLRRIFAGLSPFEPDNTHLHHYLLSKYKSQTAVLLIIMLLKLVFIAIGLLFMHYELPEFIQFYLFVTLSVIYYYVMQKAWNRMEL